MGRNIKNDKIEQIIKSYNKGLSCKKIAKTHGVTDGTIRSILIDNGVTLRPSRSAGSKKSKLSNQEILNKYESGESLEQISKSTGVKKQAVYKRLKRKGVKFSKVISSRSNVVKNLQVNEEYFNLWSEEMAYILGLIITDGNMTKNRHSFSITQKEKSILVEIAKCFGLSEENVKATIQNGIEYYHLTVSSVNMCRSLCWHGIVPNKSKKVEFPSIPKRYMGDFLRGVIDGDGTVHEKGYRVVVYTASECFAEGLNQVLHELNFNSKIHVDKRGLYRVTVSGKNNVRRLADIIYENKGDLYLKKKYFRFNLTYC